MKTEKKVIVPYFIISLYGLIMGMIINSIKHSSSYDSMRIIIYCLMTALTFAVFIYTGIETGRRYKNKLIDTGAVCALIIYGGLVIRILYIVFTTIYMRQNDVLTLEESGHLGYIGYVYIFGKPPTPGAGWEYTQPPLWYYLCAGWLRMIAKLPFAFEKLLGSLQILSLIFSAGIMVICDRIAVELRLSDKGRIISCLFCTFYPYMIFMSGAVNNDGISTFLSMLTILYAIKWIHSLSFKHLMLTGLFFGLALFAKFGSITIGPALAVLFIYTFCKKQRNIKNALEYIAFAAVSSVIGLWWPLYSKIGYGIPFGYINSASERHVGIHEVWELFFSFKNQLNHYYLNVVESDIDYDFNITSTIIKSGTFGVDNFMSDNPVLNFVGITLFWINILLAVYLVAKTVIWMIRSNEKTELKLFISLIIWVSVILLYGRAVYSAYTCNMELRFMLPAFLMMIMTASYPAINNSGTEKANKTSIIYGLAVMLMSILSICMWLMVLSIRDYESIRMIIGA